MSMQFLSATQDDKGIHYSIWLDTAKTQEDSTTPDSAYVRNYDWAPAPSDWTGGESAYQQMSLDEVKLLAQADLAEIQETQDPTPAPTPLSVQGQTF